MRAAPLLLLAFVGCAPPPVPPPQEPRPQLPAPLSVLAVAPGADAAGTLLGAPSTELTPPPTGYYDASAESGDGPCGAPPPAAHLLVMVHPSAGGFTVGVPLLGAGAPSMATDLSTDGAGRRIFSHPSASCPALVVEEMLTLTNVTERGFTVEAQTSYGSRPATCPSDPDAGVAADCRTIRVVYKLTEAKCDGHCTARPDRRATPRWPGPVSPGGIRRPSLPPRGMPETFQCLCPDGGL